MPRHGSRGPIPDRAQGAAGDVRLEAAPYEFGDAHSLSRELGIALPVAITLVRRGCRTAEEARRFLAAEEWHALDSFPGLESAARQVAAAIEGGRRITVFGDFDVDGVCATAIAIGALRRQGADCDWMIPDRLSEGYGLSPEAVERLAGRGTELLITVDNGITAAVAVAEASERGVEVIVTDHHRGDDGLPDCTVVHPRLAGYPCPELCGAGVAWKLMRAVDGVRGLTDGDHAEDLDLVALATVADLVPLRGENRSIVRRGLEVARRGRRVGLKALADEAGCVLSKLDESDLGFRLGPRINAAGRLYRADAGVELLLSEDEARSTEIAAELGRANRERRMTEEQVRRDATAVLADLPDSRREGAAIVVSGQGWHPGVIGIVASRLVEEHARPAIVITVDDEGHGRGSGRSVPGFDLLEALGSCSENLSRFGGHAAAAGLEIAAEGIEAFSVAFEQAARAELGAVPARRPERVDVSVSAGDMSLELAEELARLGPFGMGNPGPTLLVPGATVTDQQTMGESGGHCRFKLSSGGRSSKGVAFGRSGLGVPDGGRADLTVRLERNEWNGSVETRVRLREIRPLAHDSPVATYRPSIGEGEWWARFDRAMETGSAGAAASAAGADRDRSTEGLAERGGLAGDLAEREAVGHLPGSALAVAVELLMSGSDVALVCADAGRRAELVQGELGLGRFCGESTAIASFRDGETAIRSALGSDARCLLVDHDSLLLSREVVRREHVVEVDPPSGPAAADAARLASGSGWYHPVWGEAEREFALKVSAERHLPVAVMRSVYRDLRQSGGDQGEAVECESARRLLEGDGVLPRDPELCGRIAAVLCELELLRVEGDAGARRLVVVSSKEVKLESSATYRAAKDGLEKDRRFLERVRHPRALTGLAVGGD